MAAQPLRPGHAALVGREAEWRFLERALDEARRATGLVLLSGEPGVGKSRLLAEFAQQAPGWRVLRGGAFEAQGQPPYVLFVEALRSYLDEAGPGRSRRRAQLRLAALGRLLPELEADEQVGQLSPTDRQRLMELAAMFFRRLAAERPLLVVLDDLHWADPASLELLVYLRRRLRDAPLLLLAAYRDTDVDDEHPLAAAVSELNRLRLADELHLRRLPQAATADLLRALLGGAVVPGLVAAIHAQSEGNPFFVEELVRALVEDDRLQLGRKGWEMAASAHADVMLLPPGLRASLRARLRRLSQPALALLEAAALLGRRVDPALLAATEGLAEDAVAERLDEAARRHVLVRRGEGYEFAHDQLRAAFGADINPLRRRRLHERVAAAYEALGLADQHPAALAYHLLRGPSPAGARPYLVRAGERALATFAYRDAAEHLQAAAELARRDGSTGELPLILTGLGEALAGDGRYDAALATYREALALPSLDPLLMGQLHARIGDIHLAREEADPALTAHQRALAAFGSADHPEAARALLQLAELNLVALSRHVEGARQAGRALEMAERLGRAELAAEARGLLGTAEVRMGRPSGFRTLAGALDQALGLRDAALTGKIANRLAQHHYWAAELEEAARAAEQALSLLRGVADPHLLGWPTFWLGLVAFSRGEWDMAGARAAELRELGDQLGVRRFLAQADQIQGMVAQDLGRLPEAVEQLERAARLLRTIAPGTLVFYLGRSCLALLESGATAEGEACLAELESLAEALPADAKPRNSALNLVALGYLKLGRPDRDRRLERSLLPAADQLHWTLVARTLGELALARGDFAAAEAHLDRAARLATREAMRPELARTWRALARLHRGRGGPDVTERAAALDRQAADLEQALGLPMDSAAGTSPAASGISSLSTAGRRPTAGLSPRELEVLALLAEGHTNRQIAEALTISERTVINHVTHILTKLDLASRTQAALYAFRHGLVEAEPA